MEPHCHDKDCFCLSIICVRQTRHQQRNSHRTGTDEPNWAYSHSQLQKLSSTKSQLSANLFMVKWARQQTTLMGSHVR
jgi:hypothetical protein